MKSNHSNYKIGWFLIIGVLMLVWVAGVWAQPVKELTINYIEALTIPDRYANQIRVYATVTTDENKPITNLSTGDFDILEDGKKVAIEDVSTAADPMVVVLAIDTSGSMQARDKSGQTSMEAAKNAAVHFISMLPQDDQVALFSFDNEPALKMDFSDDHQMAIQAVNALAAKANAATCLYDTAFEAVKKAAEIPRGRRAIILLTDGRDEKAGRDCSMHNANDVIDIATTKSIRVPIYTIGVGPKVDARELARIASFTGGRNLLATSSADLREFYQILADQLKNQYLVTYASRTPSGEHSLVLKVLHEDSRGQDEKRFWSPPLPVSRPLSISFVRPNASDLLKGKVTVKTLIEPAQAVDKVRYYVDASLKQEYTKAPFDTFEWNTSGVSGGLHILRVEAVDTGGRTGTAELTVKVEAPSTPAAPVAAAAGKKAGIPVMVWIGVLALLAAFAGGFAWRCFQKQKYATVDTCGPDDETMHEQPAEEPQDETIFMADFKTLEPVPPASIEVVQSQCLEPGKSFKVSGITLIGRSSSNEIYIPDQSVSRKHAEIYFEDGRFHIRDLGSKNGIKLDGKRVLADGAVLKNDAEIQLAPKTILKFHSVVLKDDLVPDDETRRYEI